MDICIANLSLFHMGYECDGEETLFIRIAFRQCVYEAPLVTVIQMIALLRYYSSKLAVHIIQASICLQM